VRVEWERGAEVAKNTWLWKPMVRVLFAHDLSGRYAAVDLATAHTTIALARDALRIADRLRALMPESTHTSTYNVFFERPEDHAVEEPKRAKRAKRARAKGGAK
jgi:hypothetical protein